MLLDRKDRMSMAVGLEVRVPFCDHRLVEYVYNTPWSLKTYDNREKSLLRGATRDVLPKSVVERVKSPYPSTQDPKYPAMLQLQVKELLTERNNPVFDVFDREFLSTMAEADATTVAGASRFVLERSLDMAAWLDIYRPQVRIS
jgi:asparagine synthase (glutamine-hydrolysing)